MDKPTKLKRKLRRRRRIQKKYQIKRVESLLGNLTGFLTELRFFEAFENVDGLPSWLHKIYKASSKLDKRGVDAIAETDCGHFYIQIKSSESRALAFKVNHKNNDIGVVVPLKKDTPEYIRYQTLSYLEKARSERLEVRRENMRAKRKRKKDRKKQLINNSFLAHA